MVDSVSVRFKNESASKKCFLNNCIQWNAGTACVSECVPKTLACWGLRVDPSIGRAFKGAYSIGGRSRHLLETPSQNPF